MTTIFLLVHVLLYASGQVYTDGPWIFQEWEACQSAQKYMNTSHIPLVGNPGEPTRTAWVCIRVVQP